MSTILSLSFIERTKDKADRAKAASGGLHAPVYRRVAKNGDIFLSGVTISQGKSHRTCDLGIMVHGCTYMPPRTQPRPTT
ncbi:MAG: hypothetical protein K2J04_07010, partial [Lachnospiraceae bacterium]|nr:hypothetical protein [Lachnospiraceae bacterium]